jgi:hypothetical protein
VPKPQNLPAILQDGSDAPMRRSAFASYLKHQEHSTLASLEPASPTSLTPPTVSRLDNNNDNNNSSVDAAPYNGLGNSSNATNVVNTRIVVASTANSRSNNHRNTININADTFDNGSTDISPTISVNFVSTTTRENEPNPVRTRTPPLEISIKPLQPSPLRGTN